MENLPAKRAQASSESDIESGQVEAQPDTQSYSVSEPPHQNSRSRRGRGSFLSRQSPLKKFKGSTDGTTAHDLLRAAEVGDDMQILQALSALSMDLAVAQEEMLASMPIKELVQALINCMQKTHVNDIVLYSITCVTNILDIAPSLSALVVTMGGIGILSAKMMDFEFIDMPEHAVKALEKVSVESPSSILQEGAFASMLSMLDFFEIGCQKLILNIAINIARSISSRDLFRESLVPCLPSLMALLEFRGSHYLTQNERTLDFFTVLSDSLSAALNLQALQEEIDNLTAVGIVKLVLDLFESVPPLQTKVLRLLKTFCRHSSSACAFLLSTNGVQIIEGALSTLHHKDRTPPLASEALGCIEAILPSPRSDQPLDQHKQGTLKGQYLQELLRVVFELVIPAFESFTSNSLKALVVVTLDKAVGLASLDFISQYVNSRTFASFMTELLSSENLRTVKTALEVLVVLYEKAPQAVSNTFARAGVLAKVDLLRKSEHLSALRTETPDVPGGNLHRLLATGELEPHMLEELMHNIRRNPLRNSENRRAGNEVRSQIPAICRKLLKKCKKFEGTPQVSSSLRSLAESLEMGGQGQWERLGQLLEASEVFEFCQSGLILAIWDWLTLPAESSLLSSRLQEFLQAFLPHVPKLLGLIIGGACFERSFAVNVDENAFPFFKQPPKVSVQFVYTPQEPLFSDPDFQGRHQLFESFKKFTVPLEPSYSFDNIKTQLLKVKNKDDAKNMRFMFRFENYPDREQRFHQLMQSGMSQEEAIMEIQAENQESQLVMPLRRKHSEYTHTLAVELAINDNVVPQGAKIMDFGSTDSLIIKFWFVKTEIQSEPQILLMSKESIFESMIENSKQVGLDANDKAYPYLRLAKLIYQINRYLPNLLLPSSILISNASMQTERISHGAFRSSKLTALLSRQLNNIPIPSNSWTLRLPVYCKFLFPFSSRVDYLYATALSGYKTWGGRISAKHKVQVSREKILDGALVIFTDTKLLKQGPLDIEYEGEVGTGVGPTLEFYSLVSSEIRCLQIWRPRQEFGLFPAPIQTCDASVFDYFSMLGKLVAKAIIDRKQVDLPFNKVWWRLVLGQKLTLIDLEVVDPEIGKTVLELQEMVNLKQHIRNTLTGEEQQNALNALKYKDCSLQDLCLNFTLPGYDTVQLKPNGYDILVSLDNLEEYIELLTGFTLLQTSQALAFRRGIESLLPVDAFSEFSPGEMESLVCGDQVEDWSFESLMEAITPDHGYTNNSPTFINFLHVLTSFNNQDKKAFLQFATGSTRLPLGGIAALKPKLTVVRKEPSCPDLYLPSVMTCQNYLKLPDYSTLEVLETQLRYAMTEGFQSFHLS